MTENTEIEIEETQISKIEELTQEIFGDFERNKITDFINEIINKKLLDFAKNTYYQVINDINNNKWIVHKNNIFLYSNIQIEYKSQDDNLVKECIIYKKWIFDLINDKDVKKNKYKRHYITDTNIIIKHGEYVFIIIDIPKFLYNECDKLPYYPMLK